MSGLPVCPGDLVVADDDGVIVITAGLGDETMRLALARSQKRKG